MSPYAKSAKALDPLDEEWLHVTGADQEALPELAANRYRWYMHEANYNRTRHRWSEVLLITTTASVPTVAAFGTPVSAPALLGAIATAIIGFRQLYQWHAAWLSAASTAVDIQREIAGWNQGTDRYAGKDRSKVLVRQIEQFVSNETVRWGTRESKISEQPGPHPVTPQ